MEQARLPRHIAIIPDGSRRWAAKHGLPAFEGHRRGVQNFRDISESAFDLGVGYFTFWAASEDNLIKRSPLEVQFLVSLFCEELEGKRTLEECLEREVRVSVLGRWDEILKNERLLRAVTAIERRTLLFEIFERKHHLTLYFGYSGKQEMLRVIKDLYDSVLEGRWLSSSEDISEETINKFLGNLPPLDLVIRTGACEEGPNWSHNSSGFMMWLAADAKIFSPPTLWPDFTVEMFRQTVADYSGIPRRFGA